MATRKHLSRFTTHAGETEPLHQNQNQNQRTAHYRNQPQLSRQTFLIRSRLAFTSIPAFLEKELDQHYISLTMDPSNSHSMGKSSPTALRSLIWEGSIPLCFMLEPSELPPGSDRGVEAFYVGEMIMVQSSNPFSSRTWRVRLSSAFFFFCLLDFGSQDVLP
jgi:hypothetical protein